MSSSAVVPMRKNAQVTNEQFLTSTKVKQHFFFQARFFFLSPMMQGSHLKEERRVPGI